MGKIDNVGGLEYLAELPEKVPTTANAMKYIKIVEEKSSLRKLIRTANEIIELGYNQTEDVDNIMEGAEKKIFNIMQDKDQKGYSPLKDVLVESFTKLEELYNRKQHITGVPSGFTDLDYRTASLVQSASSNLPVLTLLLSTIDSEHKILFTSCSFYISKLNTATGTLALKAAFVAIFNANAVFPIAGLAAISINSEP